MPSPLAAATGLPLLPSLRERDIATEDAADALYNAFRIWNAENAYARWTLVGPFLIAKSWINREFWVRWNHTRATDGRPSSWQWLAMVVFGFWSAALTRMLGAMAERALTARIAALPKDHAHALPITNPALHHLSLINIPITLRVSDHDEVIEFVQSGNEIHVQWDENAACLWIAHAQDGNLLPISHVSDAVSGVTMRKRGIEVSAGPRSCIVSFQSLSAILEELQLGGKDILCRNFTYTSISTNAAQTVRFESIT